MSFIHEFKTFISKGNVIDLAVGVIIGAAFGKIVTSLVEDIVMPPLGKVIGGVDFTFLKYVISPATKDAAGKDVAEVAVRYGNFLQICFNFLLVAFVIFLVIKAFNKLKRKQEEAPVPPPEVPADVKLLTEIRDLLATRKI